MSRVPEIKRLRIEDITEPPEWLGEVFGILNTFAESVVSTLTGQIDLDTNIRSRVVDTTFTTRSNYISAGAFDPVFVKGLPNSRANGVVILRIIKADDPNTPVKAAVMCSNWTEDGGNIKINYISGLSDSTRYSIRLLVI